MKHITKLYLSMGEFLSDVRTMNLQDYMKGESKEWKGAPSIHSALDKIANNDVSPRVLKAITDIVSKIDASVHNREKEEWMPSVAGAYPIVPDYLIGMPECMRARRPVESDVAPIRLIVETGFAAMASQDLIQSYGACITALAMVMSETRAVELWVMDSSVQGSMTTTFAIKLDQPVNVAQCATAMADPVIGRMMALNLNCHEAKKHFGRQTHMIGFGLGTPSEARADAIRKTLGFEPHDVVIQTKLIPDSHVMMRDPVEWVNKQLEKQRTIED